MPAQKGLAHVTDQLTTSGDDTGVERGTVSIYEQHARDWQARRPPRRLDDAKRFRGAVSPGVIRADIGCGAGGHISELGVPVVALDAASSMLELVAEAAPGALRVQGDLEALPFRAGSLGGAWSRASYLHVPGVRLPMALAHLHWAMAVGGPVYLDVRRGDREGPRPGDDFPGRFFSEWQADRLCEVMVGAGFAVDDVDVEEQWVRVWGRRQRTLPDTVGLGMRLLVCGLNPSVYAADAGVGYARPGNRFWPAAEAAGLVVRDRDPIDALRRGIGMTDFVKRATPSAAELRPDEYRDGARRVERLVHWLRPRAVCFVGLAGWRAAVDRRATAGAQPAGFGGATAYVMPSTSGLNAHASFAALVEYLRAAASLAGLSS
jgi:TDG/mug DNA glycosylase family protein